MQLSISISPPRWSPGPLALLIALSLCGCSFDATGMSVRGDSGPALDGPPGDDLAPWDQQLLADGQDLDTVSWLDVNPVLDTTPPPDGPPPADGPPPQDAPPPLDTKPPLDTTPPPDTVPVCGPGNCAGCCSGNTCETGLEPAACGKGGVACANCWSSKKICGASGSCTGCANSLECPGDFVCVNIAAASGLCEPAYNRGWWIFAYSAEIGKDYDNYSAPDCYAVITAGSKSGKTNTVADSYKPVWNKYIVHMLSKTTAVAVAVWDHDASSGPDYIGEFSFSSGVPIGVLKNGEHTFSGVSGAGLKTLVLKFEPAP